MCNIIDFPAIPDWFSIFGMLCNMPDGWDEAVDDMKEINIKFTRHEEPEIEIVLIDGTKVKLDENGDTPEELVEGFKGMLK